MILNCIVQSRSQLCGMIFSQDKQELEGPCLQKKGKSDGMLKSQKGSIGAAVNTEQQPRYLILVSACLTVSVCYTINTIKTKMDRAIRYTPFSCVFQGIELILLSFLKGSQLLFVISDLSLSISSTSTFRKVKLVNTKCCLTCQAGFYSRKE